MKQWFNKLTKKRWVMHAVLLVILAVVLFFPVVTHAGGFSEGVAKFFGHLVAAIIWLLGKLLVLIIYLVVQVATYNDFNNSAAVDAGWEIVRDVCNMFFILLLLIIAFGTILNIKEYHWKHALPKLLLMAVLINFSKLICGVIIDFAQVVMLTFVNGFRDIAGGNLADMAGIMDLLNVNAESGDVNALALAGTYFLALIYIVVALIVMTVILFVLIMRIIMLWILVVLSPLAYLLSSTEKTKAYAGQWLKQFGDNVVAGPLLAFFIWLSFAALQQGDVAEDFGRAPDQGADTQYYSEISGAAVKGASVGLATAGTPNGMLKFIISMGMLLGGLMMTKQLSGAVGEIAGKGLGAINSGAAKLKIFGKNTAFNTGKAAAQTSLRAGGAMMSGAGNLVNKGFGGTAGESLQKSGLFLNSWGRDIKKTRQDEKTKKRKATLEKLGMKEQTMDYGKEALNTKLGRSLKGGLTMGAGGALMLNPLTAAQGLTLIGVGAAHMGGALSHKFIGKKIKDTAKQYQQNRNIKLAGRSLDRIEKNKEKEKVQRLNDYVMPAEQAIKSREQSRDKALHDIDDQLKSEVRNAKNSNATQADIDNLYTAAEQKRVKIKVDAEIDIKQLQDELNQRKATKSGDINRDIDEKYRPVFDETLQFGQQNVLSKKRDRRIDEEEIKRASELHNNNNDRKAEIKRIQELYKDAPSAVRDKKVTEANQPYNQKAEAINKKYDAWLDEFKKRSVSTGNIPNTELDNVVAKSVNTVGEKVATYQPNRLTIEAMKLGSKEFESARNTRDALGDNTNTIMDFPKSTWSTPTGLTSGQEKLLAILADNSKDSVQALQKMSDDLKKLQTQGKLSDDNKGKLEGLMRGIANITDKKPETKSAFISISEVTEQLHPEGKKINDFKPKKKK